MTRPAIAGTLESALYARDLDRAEAFYAGTLGLPVVTRQAGRHVFFRVGASILLIFNPAATAKGPAPDARLPVPAHGATGPGHPPSPPSTCPGRRPCWPRRRAG